MNAEREAAIRKIVREEVADLVRQIIREELAARPPAQVVYVEPYTPPLLQWWQYPTNDTTFRQPTTDRLVITC